MKVTELVKNIFLGVLVIAGTWYAPYELSRAILWGVPSIFKQPPPFEMALELTLIWVGYTIAGIALAYLVFRVSSGRS